MHDPVKELIRRVDNKIAATVDALAEMYFVLLDECTATEGELAKNAFLATLQGEVFVEGVEVKITAWDWARHTCTVEAAEHIWEIYVEEKNEEQHVIVTLSR